jgi:RNA polymerase sigma-70 factor (family 1)
MIRTPRNTVIDFKDGEKTDLKDFFYHHYPEFATLAGRYIPDTSVCEDIVQDVFISFWEKHKNFPSLLAAKAFFYTSIRNSCLDHLKHDQVQQKYQEFKKAIPEETGSFLDEIIKLEAYRQVYQEINKLPEMERKVLLLALDEKSNEEIATSLNISINTVRTHKARAYKVLRKNLGDIFLFFMSLRESNIKL